MRGLLLALMMWLLAGLPGQAAPPSEAELFAKANQAYQESRFARASELYRQLVDQGVDDATVWYNLGNTYFQLQDLGHARACYERARLLAPWDQDVTRNLAVLRGQLQDLEPNESWLVRLAELFRRDHLAILGGLCNFLTVALTLAYLRSRHEVAAWGAVAALVGLLFFGGLWVVRWMQPPRAQVIPETVLAKNGPGREFTDSVTLHAGSEVFILGQEGDWCEVNALGQVHGWLRSEDLAR